MTKRSEVSHRVAEWKARLQTRLAARIFSLRDSRTNRWVRRLLKADLDAPYMDPELEHPAEP